MGGVVVTARRAAAAAWAVAHMRGPLSASALVCAVCGGAAAHAATFVAAAPMPLSLFA